MSRNFELLRKLSQEGKSRNGFNSGAFTCQVPEPSACAGDPPQSLVACKRPSTKVYKALRFEISKLIDRLFLAAAPATPPLASQHAVVFCGFEPGDAPGLVTAITSDMLAEEVPDVSVCAVDADFSNPSLHDHFWIVNKIGLADALRKPAASHHFTHRIANNLWIMPCGGALQHSSGFPRITSRTAAAVIADLRRTFDYVLMTSGSITASSDCLILGQTGCGVILVIEANSTRREVAEKHSEGLRAANITVLGAVLHHRAFPIPQSL
jgi:protein-tyrosine kinase